MKMILLGLLSVITARAELPPQAPPPAAAPAQQAPAPANRGIQIFDDRVFKLSVDEEKPKTRKSASGTERTIAEEPDYNTEQRDQWIQTCSPMGKKSQRAYKECYEGEKRKSRESGKRRINEIERRQEQPLRNTDPIVDEPKGGDSIMPGVEVERQ